MYSLIKPLSIEYELNRGARPSGYAKVKLTIQAITLSRFNERIIVTGPVLPGNFRITEYTERESEDEIKRLTPGFVKMALAGIQEGCLDALANFFGSSEVGIRVLVESVSFDLIFSTQFAFRVAARTGVSELLKQAKAENLLIQD